MPGWIKAARQPQIACFMMDYSEGGAQIKLAESAKLPPRFDLCIPELCIAIPCELRHTKGLTIGVEFERQGNRRTLTSALATETLLVWLSAQNIRYSEPAAD